MEVYDYLLFVLPDFEALETPDEQSTENLQFRSFHMLTINEKMES